MAGSNRVTVPQFTALKGTRRLSMVTAYDFPFARLVDQAGIDAVLVGDSLAMVVQGRDTTLPVTVDEMVYHAELVGRAVKRALVVVDLPFPSYHLGVHKAIEVAGRILKETRAQAVKLEGGVQQAEVIAALVAAGIPVMAHCGLGPQSIHNLGGYRVQRDTDRLLADARAVVDAGAFAMVLECVSSDIGKQVTEAVRVPTIGIGAGPHCDGQVLVLHDLLGMHSGYVPRFVKAYAKLGDDISQALRSFRDEVESGEFPGPEHGYQ